MKLLKWLLPFSCICAHAQTNADIYLFNIKGRGDTVRFEYEKNITKREGYDNQPCFSPDGRYVYYSAKVKLTHDIYRYDLEKDRIVNISKSPYSSEFSPMVMEDGQNISAVFIEEDSVTQRLWKINIGSAKPKLINKKIDSVGYYWPLGNNEYASFILGTNEQNHTLRIINTANSTEDLISDSIAGCIRTFNKTISFIREPKSGVKKLMFFEPSTRLIYSAMDFPAEATDYVWFGEHVLIPQGDKISIYKLERDDIGRLKLRLVIERDLSESPVINARRPAISPDGTKLMLVGDDEKINE